ncbi:hypothetical protein NLX83_06475 [Allokutzneria sp. A3M-2-11 16]|uniref:hypothetical protein n=1 Tax=Allokutzneria sp. A3M-2-11 16 TaxID=2962043 RepID=UPI0020B84ED9|nr:hypothetical protein [Allokutzneria sp. A3M-2-11 16]MCP3798899.1 hypothetical protein [Allokutzneria sp. A3M-2-11 16]
MSGRGKSWWREQLSAPLGTLGGLMIIFSLLPLLMQRKMGERKSYQWDTELSLLEHTERALGAFITFFGSPTGMLVGIPTGTAFVIAAYFMSKTSGNSTSQR